MGTGGKARLRKRLGKVENQTQQEYKKNRKKLVKSGVDWVLLLPITCGCVMLLAVLLLVSSSLLLIATSVTKEHSE
jgi:hypothetical protein